MRKVLTLMGLLMLGSTMASAQKKWTLEDCISYAMANNITLKKSGVTMRSAQEDVKQSKSALLPSLSFSTSHSVGYRPWVNDGISTVTNGTVATSVNKTYYNGSYGLSASMTLWNGNQNLNTIKLNKLTAEQAVLDSTQTANSVQEQIAQLYVQTLYSTEALKAFEQSLETSKKNEERGKEMVEVGSMSKADLAQLTAQRAQDEYSIVEAQTNIANYKLQLRQLLEITDASDFDIYIPETTNDDALADVPSFQSVYEAALLSRPEIESAKMAIKSSEINIDIAKAGKLPTISLNGSVGTSTTSMSDKNWGNQFKTNFDAGIGASLSIPIFDNRQTKTKVNKAKLERESNYLDLQDAQKTLYATIEKYWLDANNNQQKFRAAQSNVESEQASYDLLSEQFRLGLKNIVELMTGKSNLLTAQQNMLQSKYMTILDIQLLNFYKTGEMK